MKKMVFVCAVVSMMVAVGIAGAQKGGAHPFVKECAPEINKLCKDVKKGDGAIAHCLVEHKDALKPKCTTALKQAKRVAMFRKACGADVTKLCKDASGKTLQCLNQHQGELSETCKTRLAARATRKGGAGAHGKSGDAAPAADAQVADEAAAEEQQQTDSVDVSIDLGTDDVSEAGGDQ